MQNYAGGFSEGMIDCEISQETGVNMLHIKPEKNRAGIRLLVSFVFVPK